MIDSIGLKEARPDPWFVLWTASRAEKKVEARLAVLGFAPWLPTMRERRRWSDRWREVVSPLFPGYLFARFKPTELHEVLRTRGILTVVKHNGQPAVVADGFLARLRSAVERGDTMPERVKQIEDYNFGDEVIVQDGVLKGMRGVVRECRSRRQLVIWLPEIGRGVALTIGSALVKAAGGERCLPLHHR